MILGTAGHIDHGKTTLVRALTGVDTDRLPEEKRRGITIELGFAPLTLDGLDPVGIVDVPGHEGFVRTMLAGATGMDLALLVIAADEGIMPQTREHLSILTLLGVRGGVVALTKCDAAEPDWMDLVEEEVRALCDGGALAGAPIVRCSAVSGEGIPALRVALAAAVRAVPARATDDLFRLPVDRAFSVKGTGTVVTGTLWSGSIGVDDQVVLLPHVREARVRGVERHGTAATTAVVGGRAAIALGGVDRADVGGRGSTLVRAGDPWVPATALRADVALLDGASALGPRTRVRFHLGTAEVGARVVRAGGALTAGTIAPVRVVLDAPVVARAGDRFVLRTASPVATIGGGVVTDPAPPRRRARPFAQAGASVGDRLAALLADGAAHGVPVASLPVRLGVRPTELDGLVKSVPRAARVGDVLFAADVVDSVRAGVLKQVAAWHKAHPLEPGAPVQTIRSAIAAHAELVDAVVAGLVAEKAITVAGGIVAKVGWQAASAEGDSKRTRDVLDALVTAGQTPPSVDELAAIHGKDVIAILKLLAKRGDLVAVAADRYFGKAAVIELEQAVSDALRGGQGMTASQVRERLGLTRKYLIPFLEYCDRRGVTVRKGDLRVGGPAARPGR